MQRAALLLCLSLAACVHEAPATSTTPALDQRQVTALVPAKLKDRAAWADDVVAAIRLTNKEPTAERVCAVLAIIEQESGFAVDPVVASLPSVVKKGLVKRLEKLGPLAEPMLAAVLEGKAPGDVETFGQRLEKLHTERDLDRLFRDVAKAYRDELPGPLSMLGAGAIEQFNPVTTAGSMQVKVTFAKKLADGEGLDDDGLRELLYTRAGGVRFGTARLIGYPASYDDVVYRFADYNAGVYASRNAAFQEMLGAVTGVRLVPDGDLLHYGSDDKPSDKPSASLKALLAFGAAHELSSSTINSDARKEKSQAFEQTASWKAVRAAWSTSTGKAAPYARIPEVTLSSPKMARARTTAWFASSVDKRYKACRLKLAPPR
ncbi:MAG: DUF1615 family protein [Deltaproteobacteria bacterium]|nr:DUF1615 family protein [Deltaproteobacteria bacterium]